MSKRLTHEQLREQFHPTKNGEIRFDNLTQGSCVRVWWLCPNSCCETPHEWETPVYSRLGSTQTGCPFCSERVACRCSSLGHNFPDIAKQLVTGLASSFGYRATSNKVVDWVCGNKCCETPHVWSASINNRVRGGTGCPFCSGRMACRCKSLGATRPDLASQLRDKTIDVFTLCPSVATRLLWVCESSECGCIHEWSATVDERSRGRGCPYCCIPRKKVCCRSLMDVRPDIAAEIDDDSVDPRTISSGSGQSVRFRCLSKKCKCDVEHVWEAVVASRVNGRGCPWCTTKDGKVCPCKSLQILFPSIADQLQDKTLDALRIPAHSHVEYDFICTGKTCSCDVEHRWRSRVADRTKVEGGMGCPWCTGNSSDYLCPCRSLAMGDPAVAESLVGDDPTKIFYKSNDLMEWRCLAGKGHANWVTTVASRTHNKSGCPTCRTNKGEMELAMILTDHPRVEEHWKKPMACEDTYTGETRMLTPDACGRTIRGRMFAIELDGKQHFESMSFNGSTMTDLADQMRRDLAKNRTLWKQGYSLLRISYQELDRIAEFVNQFIEDVDDVDRQILRVSNAELYKDLQVRAKAMLEGKSG